MLKALGEGYPGEIVVAIPEPHIERWYLADPRAVGAVLGATDDRPVPRGRCQRDLYKRRLREAFRHVSKGSVDPPLGGIEYGEDIAAAMRIEVARQNCQDFDRFVVDLTRVFRAGHAGS